MIRFACPTCAKALGIDESRAGGLGMCPDCKTKFRIPGAAEATGRPAAPAAQPPAVRKSKPAPPPVDDLEVVEDEPRPRRRPPEDEITDEAPRRPRRDDYDRDDRPRRRPDDDYARDDDRPRRRRDEDEDDRPRRPRRVRRRSESGSFLSTVEPFYWVLLGIVVVGLFFSVIGFLIPPVATAAWIIGVLAELVGWFWIMAVAFSDAPLHGVGCFCVPFYFLVYGAMHFEECKMPLFLWVTGFAVTLFATCAGGALWGA